MIKVGSLKIVLSLLLMCSLVLVGCSANEGTNNASPGNAPSNTQEPAAEPKSNYPEEPITWIIPFAPGGNSDLIARTTGKYLEKYLPNKGKVTFENKPGGAGVIGVTEVFNAKPDGYTIATTAAAALSIKTVEGKTDYSYDSFLPVANIASVAQILAVPADAPYQNFEEWLAYVKQNPGFKVAVSGAMNAQQLALEAFATEAGIELEFVVYGGEGEFVSALLGGHVQSGVFAQTVLRPHYESGKFVPIVNITGVKPDFLQDLPTFADLGYEAEGVFFNGVIAPKGMPEDVQEILIEAFKKAAADPELIAEMEKLGQIMDYKGPEDYQATITKNAESNREVMKKLGIIQ